MSQIAQIFARHGLIPPEALKDFQRWQLPAVEGIDTDAAPPIVDGLVIAQEIRAFIESEDNSQFRETDLDMLGQFRQHNQPGTLVLCDEDEENDPIDVTVWITKSNDFVIPFSSKDLELILTNGFTYVRAGNRDLYPTRVRDFYYADAPVFMMLSGQIVERGAGDARRG
jgi:hypothetical protein